MFDAGPARRLGFGGLDGMTSRLGRSPLSARLISRNHEDDPLPAGGVPVAAPDGGVRPASLSILADSPLRETSHAARPPVQPSELEHTKLRTDEYWRSLYPEVDKATFLDHRWQSKHSVTNKEKLRSLLTGHVPEEFIIDAEAGLAGATMNIRVSPNLLALVDWHHPEADPIRKQFIPLASERLPDHPRLTLDSLHEIADTPVGADGQRVDGLTYRYRDKALFLTTDRCPVYCRCCTRSYEVGGNTGQVEKAELDLTERHWPKVFHYIRSRPELEDIVVSGGDVYNLKASQIALIGDELLGIPHIRRIRFATKGPAVMPQKILTDDAWVDALGGVVAKGLRQRTEVYVHTHFNHPNEITGIANQALGRLFERGIFVRNQAVLQRGVNDDTETIKLLVKRLGYVNVHPYYVYLHDMVPGVEDLRTRLQTGIELEKRVRGTTAGFNAPVFVVDTPGGGGKRDAHSHEFYDRRTGISVFTAESVKPGYAFLYFDPIGLLGKEGQALWADPNNHEPMIREALAAAGLSNAKMGT